MKGVFWMRMHLSGYHESIGSQFALKRRHSLGRNNKLVSLRELQGFAAREQIYVIGLAFSQPKNNALLVPATRFSQVSQRLFDGFAWAFQEH
jgi:hypothetical protein